MTNEITTSLCLCPVQHNTLLQNLSSLLHKPPSELWSTWSFLPGPSRYPPSERLCHWRHGGRSSDLQHPIHRHLRLQLGPAGRRGQAGRAAQTDSESPAARNSQGTAFISKFTLVSVWRRADTHAVCRAEAGRTFNYEAKFRCKFFIFL